MKTYKKTSIPDEIRYKERVYTLDRIATSDYKDNIQPSLPAVIVSVLPTNLKWRVDIHGAFYKPTIWIFTCKDNVSKENGVPIEILKKGDLFKFPEHRSGTLYVYDGYNRHSKKYDYYRYNDVNNFKNAKKGTLVINDIDF